jgi:hypothetical protein
MMAGGEQEKKKAIIDREYRFEVEMNGRPVQLCIGIQPGRTRPSMWFHSDEGTTTLAVFYGEVFAMATVQFIAAMYGSIEQAIEYHTGMKPLPPEIIDNEPTDRTDHTD